MDLTTPLTIRVVSDGRAGIQNQALGLAEAVARLTPATIQISRVAWRAAFDWLPARWKRPAMLETGADTLQPPWPDLWIGCGRASLPLSLAARRAGLSFVVQVQDPRLPPRLFDLVVAPAHDGLRAENVVSIVGSPHRITPDRLRESAPAFAGRIDPLPRPRIAALIGGRSKAFDLTEAHAARLADRIGQAVTSAEGSLLLTLSRRTPGPARAILRDRLGALPGWIWDGEGPNPLFAFLAAADHVLVTEDSVNMATEAASTGRPVHILPMVRIGRTDKFERLHADLAARGATRPFDARLEDWTYDPLRETDRAATVVLQALRGRA